MLLGLTGHKGSGKSTVAKLFVEEGFSELAFANPLKEAASHLLGVPSSWLMQASTQDKEATVPGFNFTYREFMQKLGTEFVRNIISESFWLDRMSLELLNYQKKMVIISDVRFDNEAQFVIDRGGFIIQVRRDNKDDLDSHVSEVGISKHLTQYILDNNGSIEDLPSKIENTLRRIIT